MKFLNTICGVCLAGVVPLFAQYASQWQLGSSEFEEQQLQSLQIASLRGEIGGLPTPPEQGPADRFVVSNYELSHKSNPQARRLSKKASRAIAQRRYHDALSLLQQAATIDAGDWAIQNDLGWVYCRTGNAKAARQAFQRVIELDPGNALGYSNLGAVAFKMHEYSQAESLARRALQLQPLSAEARVLLGLTEVVQGHWTPEAKKLLADNSSRFPEAEFIVLHWPQAEASRSEP